MVGWMCTAALAVFLTADPRVIEGDPKRGQAQAVVIDREYLVYTGQILPTGPAAGPTPPEEQVSDVFRQLDRAIAKERLVKLNVYVHEPTVAGLVTKQLAQRYSGVYQPAVSFVQTSLPGGGVMVGLDAIATVMAPPSEHAVRREKLPIAKAFVPPAGTVYISGQAEKGDGTLADATRKTMESLLNTLKFLELSPADVVQIKAFVTPMKDSAIAVKEIAAAFGDAPAPPLSLVEWKSSLPIEIELVAWSPVRMEAPRIEYLTPPGMKASPVFARVTRVNQPGQIFISGLLGQTEPEGSVGEVRSIFSTLKRVSESAGSDLLHLAKATYYVADDDVSTRLNELRPEYYDPARPPAASKAVVTGTGQSPHRVTLDMIAVPK